MNSLLEFKKFKTTKQMKQIQLLVQTFLFFSLITFGQSTQKSTRKESENGWKVLNETNYSIQYPDNWDLNKSGQMGSSFIVFSRLTSPQDKFRENVNLIIQRINEDEGIKINFVKYHNLFVTQVTHNLVTSYKYCIIMDCLDGSIDEFINTTIHQPTISIEDRNTLLSHILTETEKNLNKLKVSRYLFTHTDMKCENLFYKINVEDPFKPHIYIADFDKSSIGFNNIRFYNIRFYILYFIFYNV